MKGPLRIVAEPHTARYFNERVEPVTKQVNVFVIRQVVVVGVVLQADVVRWVGEQCVPSSIILLEEVHAAHVEELMSHRLILPRLNLALCGAPRSVRIENGPMVITRERRFSPHSGHLYGPLDFSGLISSHSWPQARHLKSYIGMMASRGLEGEVEVKVQSAADQA